MKIISRISFIMLVGTLLFHSCTKVSEPYFTVKSVIVDTTKRSVLLEDYTGHLCVNCAPAAAVASTIQELNHGLVYVISVHAGSFARPNPTSYPPYLAADYRCETGNDWFGYGAFNIDANPKGMVNRRPFKGQISFGASDWNQAVQAAVELPKIAIMTVNNTFNNGNKMLDSKVDIKFLTGYTGKVNLTVCILEDSIYGGQLNIIPPDSIPIIKNFRFMHVLRGSLNGSFGEEISVNPSPGDLITKSYSFDFTANSWKPEHCNVIAFISDADTREVLHVAKSQNISLKK
ncbi:MAG: Omp28-related outer membrane protein [Bacteroidales bacterium]|nr:Omp28-related outer membrane protein [Bacteroidales bacterium]